MRAATKRVNTVIPALLLAAFALSGCAEKPSWKLFEQNDDEAVYFLHKSAVQSQDSVSVRHVFKQPQQFTKPDGSQIRFRVREETLMLNCGDRTYATPDYSLHQLSDKGDAAVVHWESALPEKVEWVAISNGSLAKKLMDASVIGCKA